jgi:8-oxo-dGTP diphosphatase
MFAQLQGFFEYTHLSNGVVGHATVMRSRPPAKQIVAISGIIFRDNTLLAMKRSASNDAGATLWEVVSGRVEPNEEPQNAVEREIKEETSLLVALGTRPVTAYCAYRNETPMLVVVYMAEWLSGEVALSDEHDAYAWCDISTFEDLCPFLALVNAVKLAAAFRKPL